MYKKNGKVNALFTSKIACEQSSKNNRTGSSPLTRKSHEEHNNVTFLAPPFGFICLRELFISLE